MFVKPLRTNDPINTTDNITIRKNEFSTNENLETYLCSFPTWYIDPLSTSIINSNLVESYIRELSHMYDSKKCPCQPLGCLI